MDVLNTVLDIREYVNTCMNKFRSLLKNQNNEFYVDDEINRIKDYKEIDEYNKLINEALLSDIEAEKGYGNTFFVSKVGYPSIKISYSYFKLQNNFFLYYLQFTPLLRYSTECNELIILLNTDGKYICVGQDEEYGCLMTDKFNFGEMNAQTAVFFDTYPDINEIDKNTLLLKALEVFKDITNFYWTNKKN